MLEVHADHLAKAQVMIAPHQVIPEGFPGSLLHGEDGDGLQLTHVAPQRTHVELDDLYPRGT